jgi:hypothetical protein
LPVKNEVHSGRMSAMGTNANCQNGVNCIAPRPRASQQGPYELEEPPLM